MALSLRACVLRAASRVIRQLLATAGVIALAGCGPDGALSLNAAQPRGATVAFESIDGPPPAQFNKLVENLNSEAQSRRLAVTSRENQSTYRVHGYLAAKVAKHETTISWIWDVFDRDDHRALRITGEESVKGHHPNAWAIADDAMLHRIAGSTMDQLAGFLMSTEVAPTAPTSDARASATGQVALIGRHDSSSEAAGIFRIFNPQADPLPETEGAFSTSETTFMPLPRPMPASALSARKSITLAAARR